MRWERIDARQPGRRWGHSLNAVNINGRRLLYMFGGYGKNDSQTNLVHVFDTVERTWSKPKMKGDPPDARDSHTATSIGSKLFIFGGTDGDKPLSDLYVLDAETNTWLKPATNGPLPAAREGHSAALIGEEIYVFGGCGKDKHEVYYNDLYALNTKTLTWSVLSTTGTLPSSRDSHSLCSYERKLIVFGGEDVTNSYLADVYILDVDTLKWTKMETFGLNPSPRAGHAVNCIGSSMFVFGGFADQRRLFDDVYVLDILTGVWTKASMTGNLPSRRFSLATELVDPDKGILAFHGGCNEKLDALADMYYLHSDRPEQKEVPPRDTKKRASKPPPSYIDISSSEGEEEDLPNWKKSKHIPAEKEIPAPYNVKPAAERIFEGKLTSVFPYGYTLEANIEGKPFRGLLFTYKEGFTEAVQSYLARKNSTEETDTDTVDREEYASQMPQVQPLIMPDQYRQLLGSSSNPFLNDLAF